MEADLVELLKTVGPALIGGILLGLFIRRGYSARATKLSLPFVDIDISRFNSLSAVKFFSEISAVNLVRVEDLESAVTASSKTPLVLIHTGWNIVCEAFVQRFQAYPSDEQIYAATGTIGGQNVEFVKMYRDIHIAAIRHSASVDQTFASNYLLRAPSLAERIRGDAVISSSSLQNGFLTVAQSIVQKG